MSKIIVIVCENEQLSRHVNGFLGCAQIVLCIKKAVREKYLQFNAPKIFKIGSVVMENHFPKDPRFSVKFSLNYNGEILKKLNNFKIQNK